MPKQQTSSWLQSALAVSILMCSAARAQPVGDPAAAGPADLGHERGAAATDRVTLRSGRVIEGRVIEESAGQVRMLVMTEGVESEVVYKREYITDVRRGVDAAPENVLCPDKRPRREIRATLASYRRSGGFTFSDKLMMRTMNNPQRIAKGEFFSAAFSAYLDPRTLTRGTLFGIAVNADRHANFGPMQEGGGGISQGAWFEAEVLEVRPPAPSNAKDRGGVMYQLNYLVMPHPSGDPDQELAIPIVGVTVAEIRDDRPDFRSSDQDAERLASAIGQLGAGIEGYFTAGAMQVVGSKLSNMVGTDQSAKCYFLGPIKRDTPCYVRIDEDAIY